MKLKPCRHNIVISSQTIKLKLYSLFAEFLGSCRVKWIMKEKQRCINLGEKIVSQLENVLMEDESDLRDRHGQTGTAA